MQTVLLIIYNEWNCIYLHLTVSPIKAVGLIKKLNHILIRSILSSRSYCMKRKCFREAQTNSSNRLLAKLLYLMNSDALFRIYFKIAFFLTLTLSPPPSLWVCVGIYMYVCMLIYLPLRLYFGIFTPSISLSTLVSL